jgi:HD-GYP domain-containing protein (c-di-GMP phosphodiesterase class II)
VSTPPASPRATLLAQRIVVTPILPLAFGATGGALLLQEFSSRERAERLAAALLETLLNAIDANDSQTGAHVRRVARFALILADAAELDERTRHSVERIALFHDLGKISEALFDIIHDDSGLSPAERREIATHPQRGADVLAPLGAFYPDLPEGVLSHHERWDGTGYPRRLRGEQIPIAARVVAIADTFDAITFSRRYRRGRSPVDAADRIAAGRGTQFDPDLTDLFLLPPVFEQVEEAMSEALRRTTPRPSRDRRRGAKESEAPDVNFRWRDAAIAPPQ